MSDTPPDFSALARRYLDLWQEQVAAVAADPALGEAVARGVAMMTQTAAAVAEVTGVARAKAAPGGKEAGSDERTVAAKDSPSQAPQGAATDGPPPPAPAPDDARLHYDQLARRVAALEGRIAALEAALGGDGDGPARKPRRRRA